MKGVENLKNKFIKIINFICSPFLLIGLWIIIFLSVFIFAFTSHASTGSNPKLPILVENIDVTPYQNWINNRYGGFWNLSQDNVIGWGSQENGYFVQTFAIPQVPSDIVYYFGISPSNVSDYYPDFNYESGTITLTFTNLANDNYRPWRIIHFYSNGVGSSSPYADAFNTASSINKGVYGSTGAVLNYISSDIYYPSNNAWVVNQPVFVTELPPVVPVGTGHATPPDEFETPVYTTGHVRPDHVPPNVTYNTYNWTTYNPPSFDDSGIIEVIKSEIQVINYLMGWLKDNIHGEFSTLLSNLKDFINYIGATLQYYLGLILDAIINGFTNFYNNMVSLIEPFIEFFTEPVDTEEVNDAIENTQLYGLIEVGSGYYDLYTDFFDDIEEVDTLRFSIPYTILTHTGYIIVDFSWYDDIRDLIVPWIVGFLYAGFGLFIFRSIPSIIHGVSGILQKGG